MFMDTEFYRLDIVAELRPMQVENWFMAEF
jgi:hypothetical protein